MPHLKVPDAAGLREKREHGLHFARSDINRRSREAPGRQSRARFLRCRRRQCHAHRTVCLRAQRVKRLGLRGNPPFLNPENAVKKIFRKREFMRADENRATLFLHLHEFRVQRFGGLGTKSRRGFV